MATGATTGPGRPLGWAVNKQVKTARASGPRNQTGHPTDREADKPRPAPPSRTQSDPDPGPHQPALCLHPGLHPDRASSPASELRRPFPTPCCGARPATAPLTDMPGRTRPRSTRLPWRASVPCGPHPWERPCPHESPGRPPSGPGPRSPPHSHRPDRPTLRPTLHSGGRGSSGHRCGRGDPHIEGRGLIARASGRPHVPGQTHGTLETGPETLAGGRKQGGLQWETTGAAAGDRRPRRGEPWDHQQRDPSPASAAGGLGQASLRGMCLRREGGRGSLFASALLTF